MDFWSKETIELVKSLNKNLAINHKDWHKYKGKKDLRAAELISSALCQLIIGNNKTDSIAYLEESINWLKGINVDKPCPDKKSPFKS